MNKICNNKKSVYGGAKLLSALMTVSTIWLAVYLFFSLRYPNTISQFIGYDLPSPFFSVNDRWMDFLNPIKYAWDRRPYEAQNGNSPPFMMLIAYLLSYPIKKGCSEYLVYLCFYTIVILFGIIATFKLLRVEKISTERSCFLTMSCFLSFPYVYCFDRGNYVFLASVFVLWFIYFYKTQHYKKAAFFCGLAAALKIHPALLGTVFLADKRYKEALICALTGMLSTIVSVFFFKNSFVWNLMTFLNKSGTYTQIGNGVIQWLVDDKNSFYQLILIPKMLGASPIMDISAIPEFVSGYRYLLTIFLVVVVLICFFLPNNHDRILILSMLLLGYPIESGVYNLVMVVGPILFWCMEEKENKIIPVLGVLLITMKSVFIVRQIPVLVTLQAIINPLDEALIILYVVVLRFDAIKYKLSNLRGGNYD